MPLSITLGPGNEHDSKKFDELINDLKELNKIPEEFYGDSSYDNENIRNNLESMNIKVNIQINSRNGRRPKPYNIEIYKKMRSAIEKFFGWIKSFRKIIIRYERLAITYKAFIIIACIIIHLRYGIWR